MINFERGDEELQERHAERRSILNYGLGINAALKRAQLKSVIVIFPIPKQEILTPEMEQILYDNLWEMYEN